MKSSVHSKMAIWYTQKKHDPKRIASNFMKGVVIGTISTLKGMNICRAPKMPPLLVNNFFILNCKEKAKYFNVFFSQQCKHIVNISVLQELNYRK